MLLKVEKKTNSDLSLDMYGNLKTNTTQILKKKIPSECS